MFDKLKSLFSKKKVYIEKDFSASVFELWTTDFSKEDNRRFIQETGDGYSTSFENGFSLELQRKNLFAWSTDNQYQYKNLCIETILDFTQINKLIPETSTENENTAGCCAYGFLFRYVNDSNYYMFLVSNNNQFRFDVVFNGNQIPLLGWTEIPSSKKINKLKKLNDSNKIPLQIIVNNTFFTFIINEQLAATIQDDIIQSEGYIAFAGQNWQEHEKIKCNLPYFVLDSRELQTDAAYQQWNTQDFLSNDKHLQLAESLCAVARYVPALIELKKIDKTTFCPSKMIILEARINMALHLYEEAISLLKEALSKNNANQEFLEEYVSALYLASKYEDIDILYESNKEQFEQSAILSNLKAHIYVMQNNHKRALELYQKASSIQPKEPAHLLNISLTYEKMNENNIAFDYKVKTIELYLELKDFQHANECLLLIEDTKLSTNQKAIIDALKGKLFWYIDDLENAKQSLENYLSYKKIDKTDHEALFILALIYKNEGQDENALTLCNQAIEINSNNNLYLRTRAEIEISLGQVDKAYNDLLESIKLNENDGWSWFYKAQINYNKDNLQEAKSDIFSAASFLPEELVILNLYGKILAKENRLDQALSLIESSAKHAGHGIEYRTDAYHLIANFLKDDNRFDEAESYYKKALDYSPKDKTLLIDYADLCVKENKLTEADSLISSSFTDEPNPKVSQLIACIAVKKGDYVRAEIALRQGIADSDKENLSLELDLANLYLLTNKIFQVQEIIKKLDKTEYKDNSDYKLFLQHYRQSTMRELSCAQCTIKWYVPKNLSNQGKLTITAQPPDNMPAGICPSCGNIYCIGCAKDKMTEDGRFHCLACGENLKLQDSGIIKLLNDWSQNN